MPRVSAGQRGSIRAHCSSENQKKSAIAIPPRRRQVNHISLALGIPFMGPDPSKDLSKWRSWNGTDRAKPRSPEQFGQAFRINSKFRVICDPVPGTAGKMDVSGSKSGG